MHNDRISGQLDTFLVQLHQADTTCNTEAVTEDSTLLNACAAIQDKLHTYIQAARDYVSKQ